MRGKREKNKTTRTGGLNEYKRVELEIYILLYWCDRLVWIVDVFVRKKL